MGTSRTELLQPEQWEQAAANCKDEATRERLADLLLKLSDGEAAGAHSEDPTRSWHARKIVIHEVGLAELDEWHEVRMPFECVESAIRRAVAAGLSPALQLIWILHEDDLSPAEIAGELRLHVSTVYRRLRLARCLLFEHVSSDAWFLFLEQIRDHKRLRERTRGNPSKRERKWVYGANGWE
jgi:hypothetical protein